MVDRVANFLSQEIRFVDRTITIEGRAARKTLDADWTPCSWSVICARTKDARNHMGNKRLRVLIESNLDKYATANRIEKGIIVSSIIDNIRQASNGGGFVKQNKAGIWMEVGDAVAREKVGQAIRESLAKNDPAKIQQRKERKQATRSKKSSLKRMTSLSSETSSASVSTAETSAMTVSSSTSTLNCEPIPQHIESSTMPPLNVEFTNVDFDPLPLEAPIPTSFVIDLEKFHF